MGRDSDAARAIRQAFANHDLPTQQIRRQVLLYLDNTLFCHDRDPYRLLGLAPDCSLEDIRLRHKQMLQVFHPDRHPDEEAWFTDRSEQLNRAYAYLKANHGKPGSASVPPASTVTASPPPGPAAASPRQRRHPPPPVFPNKEELRRTLNRWLGNPASLQKRVYIALFAAPVLALLLLYLTSETSVKPTSSTIVTDTASETRGLDREQTPPAQHVAPYNPAMEPERDPGSKDSQQNSSGMIAASQASDRPPETDVAMIEIDHPDEIRVSTANDRTNSAARDANDATISAVPRQDASENHREPNEAKTDQVTVTSGAGAESIHPADADISAEIPTIVSAPQKPDGTAANDATDHNQQADAEAKSEADKEPQSRTELASTAQTPAPGLRAPDPQLRSPVAAIHALLKTYESAYNRSDIDAFANLFRDNAQTKNAANRSEIRKKYGNLFRKTTERNLVVDDVRVRILGEHQYEVKTSYKVDWTYPGGKTSSSTGRFNIHVVTIDGELKIWRLEY